MRGNSHVRCGAGEKPEIISNAYLLLTIAQRWNRSIAVSALLEIHNAEWELYSTNKRTINDFRRLVMLYRKLGNMEVSIPVIGQGTWKFGEEKHKEKDEIEALRFGIENGLTLIDTAEEYGNGGAETVVGQAIQDIRNEVFLVTKVSARNCSYKKVLRAAEESLERLKTSHIDLYLQH